MDGEIDFSWDATKIYNHVKACPGAFFYYKKEQKIMVLEAIEIDDPTDFVPGVFAVDFSEGHLKVTTGSKNPIGFTRLQVPNKPEFAGDKFFDNVR